MKRLNYLAVAAFAALCLMAAAPQAKAQVGVGVEVGAAPICPYGYYDYPPYPCAPYGYYGPEWFSGGVFVGVGPWFHGPHEFYGHVDNRFDPRQGYHGRLPARGEHPAPNMRPEANAHFRGNEMRDGHGHVGGPKR